MQMSRSTELFIVEGQSAAHAIGNVLNRQCQQVLAMQGKIPNPHRTSAERVANHPACQRLFLQLGYTVGKKYNPGNIPYDRILIVADGDPDGLHARALLLGLFQRWLAPVIDSGKLLVATCPRFGIDTSNTRHQSMDTVYAWNDDEQRRHLASMHEPADARIRYIKGIASLTADECHTLLVNPETRVARPVSVSTTTSPNP